MLISDWFHEFAEERFPGRLAVNTGQAPESVLINGKGQFRVRVSLIVNILIYYTLSQQRIYIMLSDIKQAHFDLWFIMEMIL